LGGLPARDLAPPTPCGIAVLPLPDAAIFYHGSFCKRREGSLSGRSRLLILV